jgi:hypothetical protein
MLLQPVAVINDRPQSLTISWTQMDGNASAHPADSHGAARNSNPDSFVPINPLASLVDVMTVETSAAKDLRALISLAQEARQQGNGIVGLPD